MNEEQHIIKFKYRFGLYNRLCINDDIYIDEYKLSKYIIFRSSINIYYNNLYIYKLGIDIDRDYIFNLSNMLYKIHNPNYYRRYNHKELI